MRRLHLLIRSNWVTSLGAALMTFAVLAFGTAWLAHSRGVLDGPYVGILVIVVIPAIFLLGLLLVPLGLFVYRRRLQERIDALADRPMYLARAVAAITVINLIAVSTAGVGGATYMSSNQFCGMACHQAMEPEHVAFEDSPHSRITCVACHVGPGAEHFIKAKLNGTKQLWHYLLDDYERPIAAPVHGMRPARETCEQCHDPERFLGTKLLVRPRHREDEAVTPYLNVLLMRRGGTRADGESAGIHWHMHPDAVVEYVATDAARETIPWVSVRKRDGTEKVFAVEGQDRDTAPAGERRQMDCHDCHNRIGHDFERPEDAVDRAIADRLVSRELPGIKKHAINALRTAWTRDGAADGIRQHLQKVYASRGDLDEATLQRLESTTDELSAIWLRNVWPDRGIDWNTYPALDTHHGCFRCHDGKHTDATGQAISNQCNLCHVVLSEEEENPAILNALGLAKPKPR